MLEVGCVCSLADGEALPAPPSLPILASLAAIALARACASSMATGTFGADEAAPGASELGAIDCPLLYGCGDCDPLTGSEEGIICGGNGKDCA